MEKENRVPLLMTSHGEKQSFYNLLDGSHQTTCLPILGNKSVLGSSYGWLVLVDRTDGGLEGDCCLWNPTSMEIIQLPELENPWPYNKCILSKPPTDPDCFLVFNHVCSVDQIVYRVGDNTLFNVNSDDRLVAMVSFRGMVYGIAQPLHVSAYKFVTVHAVGDALEMTTLLIDDELPWEVPQPIPSWITLHINYLIESPCGNELLLVTKMLFSCYFNNGVHFRVFRVDVGRMECEELYKLEGQTIFISHYGDGFCRSSASSGAAIKPNSIYYTNEKGAVMYVYDLVERSTITLQPYNTNADIDPITSESYWVDLPDILSSSEV